MPTVIYGDLAERFGETTEPDWYPEAVSYLRGGADRGLFGLYLYELVQRLPDVSTVYNIGTARGHSAVCLARGMTEAGRAGTVHTFDLTPPDEPRDWHVPKQADDDPARGRRLTMRSLIERFDVPTRTTDIEFHTGDSNEVLSNWEADPPDLVFHDAEHTYSAVSRAMDLIDGLSEADPVHVFDDSYLFDADWSRRLVSPGTYRRCESIPRTGGTVGRVLRNKTCDFLRDLSWLSVAKRPFPGVDRAIEEAYQAGDWDRLEVVRDPDHAPITALIPEGVDV